MGQGNGGQLSVAPAPFSLKREQSQSFDDEDGRTIASTLIEGDALRGESVAAIREIAQRETRDVTDEVDSQRIPRAAQDAVRKYFQTLEADADSASE